MQNYERVQKRPKKTLDTLSVKRGPGRPPKVIPSVTEGRARNYRVILGRTWDELWSLLTTVATKEDVLAAFRNTIPNETEAEFASLAGPILKVLKERDFPKRRQARINFLADSIAGLGYVTPRRSRDVCAEERVRQKSRHQILRFEYYVECSCGYKGNSENHACKNCGARIYFDRWLLQNTLL